MSLQGEQLFAKDGVWVVLGMVVGWFVDGLLQRGVVTKIDDGMVLVRGEEGIALHPVNTLVVLPDTAPKAPNPRFRHPSLPSRWAQFSDVRVGMYMRHCVLTELDGTILKIDRKQARVLVERQPYNSWMPLSHIGSLSKAAPAKTPRTITAAAEASTPVVITAPVQKPTSMRYKQHDFIQHRTLTEDGFPVMAQISSVDTVQRRYRVHTFTQSTPSGWWAESEVAPLPFGVGDVVSLNNSDLTGIILEPMFTGYYVATAPGNRYWQAKYLKEVQPKPAAVPRTVMPMLQARPVQLALF